MKDMCEKKPLIQFDIGLKTATNKKSFNGLSHGLFFGLIFSLIATYVTVIKRTDSNNLFSGKNAIIQPSNTKLDDYLYNNVRVLCMMLPVRKEVLNDRGRIFMETWAKRCNIFIFFSDDDDSRFNVVVLKDKRSEYSRFREALVYIYKNHYKDFDWILKCNDNTYMVMENLRWLLFQYDTKWPLMIGERRNVKIGFIDGMEGVYVLSKESLSRVIEKGFGNSLKCPYTINIQSDYEFSRCVHTLNIILEDAIDEQGRSLFFHVHPENLLFPDVEANGTDVSTYWHKMEKGPKCCSDRLISVTNIWNQQLYNMEYYIYKVHAFGRHRLPEPLPKKKSIEDVLNNY